MVTFGERVWFRPLKAYVKDRSDLAAKLDSRVYVGTHGRNGDVMIVTENGVIKGGSVSARRSRIAGKQKALISSGGRLGG